MPDLPKPELPKPELTGSGSRDAEGEYDTLPGGVWRPPPPPDSAVARERLRQSFLRPGRGQVVVAVLLALVGFAAVTQMRATDLDATYTGMRDRELVELLDSLTEAEQRARRELAELETTRADLRDDTSRREAALAQAQQEAESLDLLAGLVPAAGPGIRITITEETGTVRLGTLLDTIQELRSADAEAIEFNDEVRVIAQTAFDVSPSGISVGGVELASPYVIDVIGNPRNLSDAMTFPSGPQEQVEDDGGTLEILESEEIRIESVRDPEQPQYAEPADPR